MAPRISEVRGAEVKTEESLCNFPHSARFHTRSQATVQLRTFTRAAGDGTLHVLQEPLYHVPRVPAVPTRLAPREPRGEHAQLRVLRYKNICYVMAPKNICYTVLTLLGSGTASTLAPVVPLPVPIFTRQMAHRGRGF